MFKALQQTSDSYSKINKSDTIQPIDASISFENKIFVLTENFLDHLLDSTCLSIPTGKMQMKSSVRYPFIPITMAITKKKQNKITVRMWRHWEPCALLIGQQNGAAPVENSMVHLQKIQDRKTT